MSEKNNRDPQWYYKSSEDLFMAKVAKNPFASGITRRIIIENVMKTVRSEFSRSDKEAMWKRSGERCEICLIAFGGRRPEFHHVIPCALGGNNEPSNGLVLCPPCHRLKTSTEDIPRISKAKRIEAGRAGLKPHRRPIPSRPFQNRRASMSEDRRAQLVAQCKAVAHLAKTISEVHGDLAEIYADSKDDDSFIDMVGKWTASRMEVLGDISNGMDIVTDEDAWLDPIFEEAHRLWPVKSERDHAFEDVAEYHDREARFLRKIVDGGHLVTSAAEHHESSAKAIRAFASPPGKEAEAK